MRGRQRPTNYEGSPIKLEGIRSKGALLSRPSFNPAFRIIDFVRGTADAVLGERGRGQLHPPRSFSRPAIDEQNPFSQPLGAFVLPEGTHCTKTVQRLFGLKPRLPPLLTSPLEFPFFLLGRPPQSPISKISPNLLGANDPINAGEKKAALKQFQTFTTSLERRFRKFMSQNQLPRNLFWGILESLVRY